MGQQQQEQQKKPSAKEAIVGPVYRAIPRPEAPQPADVAEGAAGALEQLDDYAREVQEYLDSSKMRALLNRIEADIRLNPPPAPRMRLRRE
jgi:hypothetical protein